MRPPPRHARVTVESNIWTRCTVSLKPVSVAKNSSNTRFRYMPEANRHYAARAREALDLILNPQMTLRF